MTGSYLKLLGFFRLCLSSGYQIPVIFLFFWVSLAAMALEDFKLMMLPMSREPVTMGKTVEQVLEARLPLAYSLETSSLPAVGAMNEWLEIRSVKVSENRGDFDVIYRFRIIYQVFRGTRTSETVNLKGLQLRFAGPRELEIQASDWSLNVVPLIPSNVPDELVEIRRAVDPALQPTGSDWHRFWFCVAGILALWGFTLWQKLDQSLRGMPFGRTLLKLAPVENKEISSKDIRFAAQMLHRAFDESAGQVMFVAGVELFCREKPAFAGLYSDLKDFFDLSRQIFFRVPESTADACQVYRRLTDLCRRCASAERVAQ